MQQYRNKKFKIRQKFSYFSLTNEQKAGKQKASVHISLKCTHKTDALFTSLLYGHGFLRFFYSTHFALVFNEKWQFNKNSNMRTESTCAIINKCRSEIRNASSVYTHVSMEF